MTAPKRPADAPAMNVPLMEAVMGRILAEPESWDQDYFATATECGTKFCFAGFACLMSGCTFDAVERVFIDAGGRYIDPAFTARRLLGLTYREAEDLDTGLFYNRTDDPNELHKHVKALIESATS